MMPVAMGLVGVDPPSRVEPVAGGTPSDAGSDLSGVAFEHRGSFVGDPGLGSGIGFVEERPCG